MEEKDATSEDDFLHPKFSLNISAIIPLFKKANDHCKNQKNLNEIRYALTNEEHDVISAFVCSRFDHLHSLIYNEKLRFFNAAVKTILIQYACEQHHNLEALYLDTNKLTYLHSAIGNLSVLQKLTLDNNNLKELPASIGNLQKLKSLMIGNNQLTKLPAEIGNLQQLTKLFLDRNQLTSLPVEIGNLTMLKELQLHNNQLTKLPAEIGNLTMLELLLLNNNQLLTLPVSLSFLSETLQLNIKGNPDLSFPLEIIQKDFNEGIKPFLSTLYHIYAPIIAKEEGLPDLITIAKQLDSIDQVKNLSKLQPIQTFATISKVWREALYGKKPASTNAATQEKKAAPGEASESNASIFFSAEAMSKSQEIPAASISNLPPESLQHIFSLSVDFDVKLIQKLKPLKKTLFDQTPEDQKWHYILNNVIPKETNPSWEERISQKYQATLSSLAHANIVG